MRFGDMLEDLAENGGKARRKEWVDEKVFVTFVDERLAILSAEDNLLHPLTVSTGDVLGTDWEKVRLKIVPFNKKG